MWLLASEDSANYYTCIDPLAAFVFAFTFIFAFWHIKAPQCVYVFFQIVVALAFVFRILHV